MCSYMACYDLNALRLPVWDQRHMVEQAPSTTIINVVDVGAKLYHDRHYPRFEERFCAPYSDSWVVDAEHPLHLVKIRI